MSKKLTVHCRNQKFDVEDVGGNIYIHATPVPDPTLRHIQQIQPTEMIFSGSAEEANYIAQAILTVTGHSKPLEPIEKITLAQVQDLAAGLEAAAPTPATESSEGNEPT